MNVTGNLENNSRIWEPISHFTFERSGILLVLLIMMAEGVFMMLFLCFMDEIAHRLRGSNTSQREEPTTQALNTNIQRENDEVANAIMSQNFQAYAMVVKNVHKWYGYVHSLDGVCFTLRKKEVLAIMGKNGSGKSTIFRILTAIEPMSSGEAYRNSLALSESPFRVSTLSFVTFTRMRNLQDIFLL